MRYFYYISFNAGVDYTEVFPSSEQKINSKLINATDCRIAYPKELTEITLGKLLNSSVYDTMKTSFSDYTTFPTALYFRVYRADILGTLMFDSRFSIKDCKFNYQDCVVKFTPKWYSVQYSWADASGGSKKASGACFLGSYAADIANVYYPLELSNAWANDSINPYAHFAEVTGTVSVDCAGVGTYHCHTNLDAPFYADNIVNIVISSYVKASGQTPTINLYDNSNTECGVAQNVANGIIRIVATGVATRVGLKNTNSSDFSVNVRVFEPANATPFTGVPLLTLLKATRGTADIKSTYFFNDAVSTDCSTAITTYMDTHGTYNYVTEAVNTLNDLMVVSANAFNTVTGATGEYTFAQLMNELHNRFNVWWYEDAEGKIRIEHEYWFEAKYAASIDLTGAGFTKFKPEGDRQNYEVDNSLLYSEEKWEFTEAVNEDFVGLPMTYNSYATSDQVKDYNSSFLLTDSEARRATTDDAGGLMLLKCTEGGGEYYVDMDLGALSDTYLPNVGLSIANLHAAYWTYGRPCKTGTLNGAAVTFDSSIAFYKSSAIFALITDVSDYGYVKTSFGDGLIQDYERDLSTDFINVNLNFRSS